MEHLAVHHASSPVGSPDNGQPSQASPKPVDSQQSTAPTLDPAATSSSDGPTPQYPPGGMRNSASASPCDRMLGDKKLERPEYLHPDIDPRVAHESVYMLTGTFQPGSTSNVLYLLPGACARCVSLRQFCDRREPTCGRCKTGGVDCTPGALTGMAAPTSDKGKAPAHPSTRLDGEGGDKQNNKRARKSLKQTEGDDVVNLPQFDGTAKKQKDSRKKHTLPSPHTGPLRPEDVKPTAEDEAWYRRVEENSSLPPLTPSSFCPIWAVRRQALYAATDSLHNPTPTIGASVQIGDSGIARGVLLEGEPLQAPFWGEGEDANIILAAIGPSRPRYSSLSEASSSDLRSKSTESSASKESSWPSPTDAFKDVTRNEDPDTIRQYTDRTDLTRDLVDLFNGTGCQEAPEPPVLEALFMAQRARTPVSMAVAEDYKGMPFKLPRPFAVLGWFWVASAWTVPLADNNITWMFHFQWCGTEVGGPERPWWSAATDPMSICVVPEAYDRLPRPVRGIFGSPTLRGREKLKEQDILNNACIRICRCPTCKRVSERTYETQAPCLNERCDAFFKNTDSESDGHCIPNLRPKKVAEEVPRLYPSQLNLDLIGPGPDAVPMVMKREDVHSDKWQAWVCRRCRCANERRNWNAFVCEGCGIAETAEENHYYAEDIAPPMRMKCTGPRPDDGTSSSLGKACRTNVIRTSNETIAEFVLDTVTGGAPTNITLSTVQDRIFLDAVFLTVQSTFSAVMPLTRHFLPATSSRPSEMALSPFFTSAIGERAPFLAHFPTSQPWTFNGSMADKATFRKLMGSGEDVGELEQALSEDLLDSFVVAALPGSLHQHYVATIPVPPGSNAFAVLFLGSDCTVRVRDPNRNTRGSYGEVEVQHGDRLIIKTSTQGLDLELKMDGYGCVVIARGISESTRSTELPVEPDQWYIGPVPVDPTRPLRAHLPQYWKRYGLPGKAPTTTDTFDPARGDVSPDDPGRFGDASLPWRGLDYAPPPPEQEIEAIPLPVPPEPKDSDESDEETRPSSRVRRGCGAATARGRGRTSDAGTAVSPSSRGGNPRGGNHGRGRAKGGRGRGRGRGRGGGATLSASASASKAGTPASEDPGGQAHGHPDVDGEPVETDE